MFTPIHLLLICLFPLAIYCLVLALINRRPQPVMVSGLWDCVGLIFAASGFLLVVAPTLIHLLFTKYVDSLVFDPNVKDIQQAADDIETMRRAVVILYYLLMVGGVILLLWWRRGKTIIYNVDPDRFYHLLARILGQLGYGPKPETLSVVPAPESEGIVDLARVPENPIPSPPAIPLQDLFEVEIFSALSNVTLHWHTGDPQIRRQIEEELWKRRDEASLEDNPSGAWIMGIAALLFGLSFLVAALIIWLKFAQLRGR